MKFLTLLAVMLGSINCFADSCEEKALEAYKLAMGQNEYHYLTGEVFKAEKNAEEFDYRGVKVKLGFSQSVEVHIAASEYMGGFGYDALVVDSANCDLLKIENVYAE